MTNITPILAELLDQRNVHLRTNAGAHPAALTKDAFLKEAYDIVTPPSPQLSPSPMSSIKLTYLVPPYIEHAHPLPRRLPALHPPVVPLHRPDNAISSLWARFSNIDRRPHQRPARPDRRGVQEPAAHPACQDRAARGGGEAAPGHGGQRAAKEAGEADRFRREARAVGGGGG